MCIQVWLGKEHFKAWEPEASIPPCIIRDYELGLQPEVLVQSVSYGGQTTLSTYTMKMHSPKQRNRRWKRRGMYQIHVIIM